jgi:hypothetical protein
MWYVHRRKIKSLIIIVIIISVKVETYKKKIYVTNTLYDLQRMRL